MIKVGPTHRRQVSSRCQSPVRTDSTCTFCLLIKLLIKTQHMKLKHSVTDRRTDRPVCRLLAVKWTGRSGRINRLQLLHLDGLTRPPPPSGRACWRRFTHAGPRSNLDRVKLLVGPQTPNTSRKVTSCVRRQKKGAQVLLRRAALLRAARALTPPSGWWSLNCWCSEAAAETVRPRAAQPSPLHPQQ